MKPRCSSLPPLALGLAALMAAEHCNADSIVFPAFGAPVVTDRLMVTHHTDGGWLLCLDRKSGSVIWRLKAQSPVWSVFLLESNQVAAVHTSELSVVDIGRGTRVGATPFPGHFVGRSADGSLLSLRLDKELVCTDPVSGKRLWRYAWQEPDSNVMPVPAVDLVFLAYSPRRITHRGDGEITAQGTNMLACLSAKTGELLWATAVPLSKSGFGTDLQVGTSQALLACVTSDSLRILNKATGEIVRNWTSAEELDGADFWGDDRIAVCSGGIGASTRTIRILGATDFKQTAQFAVGAREVASVETVGDVIILGSLYRNIGVDLRARKVIWTKGQRHITVHNGLLYYGEPAGNRRVLGVCDPKTGTDTILYSEAVKE